MKRVVSLDVGEFTRAVIGSSRNFTVYLKALNRHLNWDACDKEISSGHYEILQNPMDDSSGQFALVTWVISPSLWMLWWWTSSARVGNRDSAVTKY